MVTRSGTRPAAVPPAGLASSKQAATDATRTRTAIGAGYAARRSSFPGLVYPLAGVRKLSARSNLPVGTVTFLSSRLAGGAGPAGREEKHEQTVAAALGDHGGVEVERGGGAVLGVFASPAPAVAAAIDLVNGSPRGSGMRVALHTGVANGYPGPAGEHAARVGAVAAEGQVLLTATTAALVEHGLEPGRTLEKLGNRALPGLDRPEA